MSSSAEEGHSSSPAGWQRPFGEVGRLSCSPTAGKALLVGHDKTDKEIPVAAGLAVAAAWNGAKVMITQRFGHRRIMIAGEVVRAVVGFLGSD